MTGAYNKLTSNKNRWYLIIGHCAFLLFTFGCFYYYQERMLNNDAAYYTFHIANYETFFVKHQRYISYFTQALPIIIAKLGGSLKMVITAYSGGIALWFYLMYLIAAHIWKAPKEAILLVFTLVLTTRYKHYAGHTEITIAMMVATTLVIWTICKKGLLRWYGQTWDWAIKIGLIILLFIIHPIIILPLSVILGVDMIYNKRWRQKDHWTFLGALITSFLFRFITVARDSYESGKVGILSTATDVFSDPDKYFVFHVIRRYFDKEYHIIGLIFIICLFLLLKRKRIWEVLALTLGFIGILALIIVTYSYLRGNIFIMIDGYLGMLGMIIGYSILLVLYEYPNMQWSPVPVAALVLFCLIRIQGKAEFMTQRLDYYKETFAMHPGQTKLYGTLELHDWEKLWYPYEIPLETLMVTSLEGTSKTIYIDYDNQIDHNTLKENRFLIFDEGMDIKRLNDKYFNLDTISAYTMMDKVAWK